MLLSLARCQYVHMISFLLFVLLQRSSRIICLYSSGLTSHSFVGHTSAVALNANWLFNAVINLFPFSSKIDSEICLVFAMFTFKLSMCWLCLSLNILPWSRTRSLFLIRVHRCFFPGIFHQIDILYLDNCINLVKLLRCCWEL